MRDNTPNVRSGWTGTFRDFIFGDPSKGREMDLDVVRGIAILLAMGWHFNNKPTSSIIANFLMWPGHSFGWAGVDLFFVLSGFLVGRLVLQKIQATGEFDKRTFFIRRIFKLWPTLYLFLFLFLLWSPWKIFFFQIFLHAQNYFRPPVATHLWSLAVEEHFYLVFAFLTPVYFRRLGSGWGFAAILLALMILVLLERTVGFYILGISADTLQVQTQYRLDALACGVFLATISVFYSSVFDRLLEFRLLWLCSVLLGCLFLAHVPKSSPLGCTLGFTVAYLTSASLLLGFYKAGLERAIPWLCKPIALAGVYSYAIYIWHVPAEKLLDKYVLSGSHLNSVVIIFLDYTAAIISGYVMTRLLERPFLALREALFPK